MIAPGIHEPLWRCAREAVLMQGLAQVWWLDLTSPFGDSSDGIDWTIELPDGVQIMDIASRPRFGTGPDAHRPHLRRDGQLIELSFRGMLPAEGHRHPVTHRDTWCDLHFPLVVRAEHAGTGGEVVVVRRAMGDCDTRTITLRVLPAVARSRPSILRRVIQPTFLPWFSLAEHEALAHTLGHCGFTDIALNWFDHGIPLLPPSAYAVSARLLRQSMPGLKIWIGGMPGADTSLTRAQGYYQEPIPHIASPQAILSEGPDLVVAAERGWCEAVNADGVMIHMSRPLVEDGAAMPAHCFSPASRQAFAHEYDLPLLPDPLAIRHRYPDEWEEFCCRQLQRMIEVARLGYGGRPLALCLLGEGPYAEDVPATWKELGELANPVIYSHQQEAPRSTAHLRQHWGYVRLGGTPQAWWEQIHDPHTNVKYTLDALATCHVQATLSGGKGIRIGSWACLDGQLIKQLVEWT